MNAEEDVNPVPRHAETMYLSPAVRTIRDDPTHGVAVRLVVRGVDGADRQAVAAAVEERGGVVERETRFGNLHATVEEAAVAGLLEALPDGVEAVETVTPELSGDAGEDIASPKYGSTDGSRVDDR